jgi:integrase
VFASSIPNAKVADITPEVIENYLDTRRIEPESRDNDKRAISRFFSWCIERPRRWITHNPAREVKVARPEKRPPAILSVQQSERLLRTAEEFEYGKVAPYVALCLIGGLRPTEAQRLTWEQVNLTDAEIRLEGSQTKTGKPRVVTIHPTLKEWLMAYRDFPLCPSSWRKRFDALRIKAGFGTPCSGGSGLEPWPPDVMRHTAISHAFRECGSYGLVAERFGNSEAIIKCYYQGRVSSADTKCFYSIKPRRMK